MRAWIVPVALACGLTLPADSLQLKNGRVLEGAYLGGDAQAVRFRTAGGIVRRYPIADVQSVYFGASRATADNVRPAGPEQPVIGASSSYNGPYVPSGTRITVRTIEAIDAGTTHAGRTFRALLDDPIVVNGRTLAPPGARAVLRIARSNPAPGIVGVEEVVLELQSLEISGHTAPVNSTPAEVAAKARQAQSLRTAGGVAVVGPTAGAITVGDDSASAAPPVIRGQRLQVPPDARLDFTLAQPVYL